MLSGARKKNATLDAPRRAAGAGAGRIRQRRERAVIKIVETRLPAEEAASRRCARARRRAERAPASGNGGASRREGLKRCAPRVPEQHARRLARRRRRVRGRGPRDRAAPTSCLRDARSCTEAFHQRAPSKKRRALRDVAIPRGDGSPRRSAVLRRRRVAATPRLRPGYFVDSESARRS